MEWCKNPKTALESGFKSSPWRVCLKQWGDEGRCGNGSNPTLLEDGAGSRGEDRDGWCTVACHIATITPRARAPHNPTPQPPPPHFHHRPLNSSPSTLSLRISPMAAAALLLLLWVDSAAAFVPATGLLFPAGGSLRYAASTSSCSTSCSPVLHAHTSTPCSSPRFSPCFSLPSLRRKSFPFLHHAATSTQSTTCSPPALPHLCLHSQHLDTNVPQISLHGSTASRSFHGRQGTGTPSTKTKGTRRKETIEQSRHNVLMAKNSREFMHMHIPLRDNQQRKQASKQALTHGLMICQTSEPTIAHAGWRRFQGRRRRHQATASGITVRSQQPLPLLTLSA